jgi:hypothetical protein
MQRNVLGVLVASLVLLALAMPATAHHSFAAEFDADKLVTVKGVITKVRLENPHSWFFLDVKDANGKMESWSFEASTPTSLIRSGIKPGFIKNGDEVTISGWHARDASQNVGCAREIVVSDGRAFAVGPTLGPGTR